MLSLAEAKAQIYALEGKSKFLRMLHTAAILTELLSRHQIKPIIVGGLSVEIYSMNGYTTQDIDFVLNGYDKAGEILEQLDFKKIGRDWVHPAIGVSLEIPSSDLAGDDNKVTEFPVDGRVVYVIGIEDLILDRLRAAVNWESGDEREWGYRLLLMYFEEIDFDYLKSKLETEKERNEFQLWLEEAEQEQRDIAE